jgi:uncharacterized protein YkwD
MVTSRFAIPLIVLLLLTGTLSGCARPGTAVWADSSASPSTAVDAPSGAPDASESPSPSAAPSPAPSRSPTPAPASTTPKPPPVPGSSAAANAVLAQTNAWRTAAGLRPYTMLPGLVASAHKHNLVMIAGCGLSHRCPNEPSLGDRIRAQGVQWQTAGENIGESGPHPDTTTAITTAAKGLNTAMFNEKPPDDGHRRNLLSSSFRYIGIDVVRDSHGTVWLTEDFTG